MRTRLFTLGYCLALFAQAEILDRVAVSVGTRVITESELIEQIRVRALIEGTQPKFDEDSKRDAADKLIQQTLIRREMDTSRYAPTEASLADQLLANFKRDRFPNEEAYQKALKDSGLREQDLRSAFVWQLTVLRFVEFRFRPGIQIPAEELREYYETRYLPEWRKAAKAGEMPKPFEEVESTIESILTQERIDNALDRWLSQTRAQSNIKIREEVFRP